MYNCSWISESYVFPNISLHFIQFIDWEGAKAIYQESVCSQRKIKEDTHIQRRRKKMGLNTLLAKIIILYVCVTFYCLLLIL